MINVTSISEKYLTQIQKSIATILLFVEKYRGAVYMILIIAIVCIMLLYPDVSEARCTTLRLRN